MKKLYPFAMKLPKNECPSFFQFYADYVELDVLQALNKQLETYVQFIRKIPEEKHLYRYKADKWTLKEVIGHNTDTERLKASAALRLARNDKTPIPGFEENDYVKATQLNNRNLENLLNEFIAVRKSSIVLFESLTEEELHRIGQVSGKNVSANTLFYFLVGHIKHHEKIIKERYL